MCTISKDHAARRHDTMMRTGHDSLINLPSAYAHRHSNVMHPAAQRMANAECMEHIRVPFARSHLRATKLNHLACARTQSICMHATCDRMMSVGSVMVSDVCWCVCVSECVDEYYYHMLRKHVHVLSESRGPPTTTTLMSRRRRWHRFGSNF